MTSEKPKLPAVRCIAWIGLSSFEVISPFVGQADNGARRDDLLARWNVVRLAYAGRSPSEPVARHRRTKTDLLLLW